MLEQTVDDAVKNYKSIPDYLRHVAVSITNGEMDDRPVLVKFLEDLGKYCLRGRTKFSEETLSVFAAVFSFSPAAARTFALNLFGPCDSQVRLFSKRSVAVGFCIKEETLKAAANYYKSCKYKGPFEIAMDATAVTAVVRMDLKQRIPIGFVEGVEGQGPVTTGQDLYNRFFPNGQPAKRATQGMLILLQPLQEGIPAYPVGIIPVSGKENRDHISRWYETTCEFALNSGLRVIGLGADGCSLVRSYYSTKCLTTDLMCIPPDSYVLTGGAFKNTIHWNKQVNFICFSDPRHLLKKFRNPMLSLSRVMVIGDHLVDLNDVRLTFKHLKLECGIYRTDFDVSDKQNVDAVMRLIGESCFHALAKRETLNPSVSTLATRTFLKYGKMLHDAFFKRESNIGERLSDAFQFLYFLEASKAFYLFIYCSTSNSYTWKKNGLTSEEMLQDTRFTVSSLVFGYLDCVLSSFDGGYHPWMYGSDSCERCFGTCRTMRNIRELNLLDLRNSIERWFFQETLRKNSNIQVNRPKSNKRMKTTTDIQNLLCEKDFLLLVNKVSKKSLENVITDISGMFPQYFDINSQLRPYEFSKSSCINVTAMSATGRQSSVNNMSMFQQCEKCDVCGNNIDSEFCTFCSPSANEVEILDVQLLVDGVDE